MKFSTGLVSAVALALIQPALAHYRFVSLITPDGTVTGEYEYVRQNTNSNSPVEDLTSTDMRCNTGADTGAGTSTLTVNAGDEVGFQLDRVAAHPGPFGAYLSKATGDLSEYTGDGGWFKIYETTADIAEGSFTFDMTVETVKFTLPSTIESGDYLLRIEHIGLHGAGAPQFYISCAQITIENGGSVSPETVSIPGYVTLDDPSVALSIYYPVPTSYNPPGPEVFVDGGASSPAPSSSAAPAEPSSSAAAPEPSSSAAPEEPSSSAAPEEPSSSAAAPESSSSAAVSEPSSSAAVPEPSSSAAVPEPSSSAAVPEPSSSAAVPEPSSVAAPEPSSVAVPEPSSSAVVPPPASSSPAAPAPTGTTCTKDAYNCCMDAYNACADKANASKQGGGGVDFATCQSELTTCTSSISRRHSRDLLRNYFI